MRSALAALLLAAPAHADPLQDQVLAGMKAANTADVAFTQTMRIERTGSPAKEVVTRYDPHAAPGTHWTLVSIDGRPPTAKQVADAAKRSGKRPAPSSYGELAKWFGGAATVVARTPESVTYRFARLPKGEIMMGSHDASADTVADAVVNIAGKMPFVERVRLASSAPFRMMLVAKVERYAFTSSFTLLADGRPFPNGIDADLSGSLMGKAGSMRTRIRFADVRTR